MEYGTPSKLQDGRYFLKISTNEGGRVFKQINGAEFQEGNCYKVNCSLSEYDEDIIAQAEKNSESWFGRKIDKDSIKNAFDSSVSAGILEAPLAKRNSTVATKFFDENKNEVSSDILVPGTKCDILVELAGLWFIKKSFGPVWRVVQVRLRKQSSFPQMYMFKDEQSDDEYV